MSLQVTTVNGGGVEASTTLTLDVGGGPALTRRLTTPLSDAALCRPIPTQHLKPGRSFVYQLPEAGGRGEARSFLAKGMFIDTMDGEKLNFKASAKARKAS